MYCIKDKKKLCPAKDSIYISRGGVPSQDAESLLKCCKVIAQIEAAKRLGIPSGMILQEIKQRGKI